MCRSTDNTAKAIVLSALAAKVSFTRIGKVVCGHTLPRPTNLKAHRLRVPCSLHASNCPNPSTFIFYINKIAVGNPLFMRNPSTNLDDWALTAAFRERLALRQLPLARVNREKDIRIHVSSPLQLVDLDPRNRMMAIGNCQTRCKLKLSTWRTKFMIRPGHRRYIQFDKASLFQFRNFLLRPWRQRPVNPHIHTALHDFRPAKGTSEIGKNLPIWLCFPSWRNDWFHVADIIVPHRRVGDILFLQDVGTR